ncbi:MAG: hypothetical protein ACE5GK_03490 [Nitrospiria bacterium]
MWLKWLPWRFLIKQAAQANDFLDPIALQSRLNRFAQPSEVTEPIELLRAGVLFHARGLINTRAIQHNLDWVWPYWVERQFNPLDAAFIPRAFSITHVNLTHRNWTAVGLPDFVELPIVDPRGLVTPFLDGWSLDFWMISKDGRMLIPSKLDTVSQKLSIDTGLAVETHTTQPGLSLSSRTEVLQNEDGRFCRIALQAEAETEASLVVTLRPYNPEGVSFIHEAALSKDRSFWLIDEDRQVLFSTPVERSYFSNYQRGDVMGSLSSPVDEVEMTCDVGMVTAAALFSVEPGDAKAVEVEVLLEEENGSRHAHPILSEAFEKAAWQKALQGHCTLTVPDEHIRFLYDAALHSMILHAPQDVYPGPYTYKRFWFRDAAFILHAMLCAGLFDRAETVLDRFPERQTRGGYFHSQDGEWDSNGQALWIYHRFCELTGRPPKAAWLKAIKKGAEWIVKKRHPDELNALHAGLLPAGFSAEHLGPNDHYYWDDFWGIAGLEAAAALNEKYGDPGLAETFRQTAKDLMAAVETSLEKSKALRSWDGIPASPYRRMDGGAIGSLAVAYPLQLWRGDDARVRDTLHFLLENCFVKGGFFQDMIHSGINPYLTLHVAQALLQAGDLRFFDLIRSVVQSASPTGQWPEAIHPRTGGGCMGDGQHIWAAAEWVLMIRNCFIREEGETLILASGIPSDWRRPGKALRFGPAPTPWGAISLFLEPKEEKIRVAWKGTWRRDAPKIEVRLPNCNPVFPDTGISEVEVRLKLSPLTEGD